MRIAHFIQRYPPALGGSEAYFERLSRYLERQGDEVSVWTTNAQNLESFWSRGGACFAPGSAVANGVTIRRFPLWHCPGRRYLLKLLSFIPHRWWQCMTLRCNPISWPMWSEAGRARKPVDLVHASAFPYAWPIACGLRLARKQGLPFLLTPFVHTGDPDDPQDRIRRSYTQPCLLYLINEADRVFVQTEMEYRVLQEHGAPADKLVLLGMGVDAEECTGGDRWRVRQEWNISPVETAIGHLANNSVEKGTVDLLQAAAKLWPRGASFKVVLAGSEMRNFLSFWKDFAWKKHVIRLGALSEIQKRDFYAGIDVFALPSRSDSFGLVVLEAWANGVPTVAYRAGGLPGVIRDGEDGLLVRCGNLDQLADALARLMAEESTRFQLGEEGQRRIARDFRWRDKLSRVREVYEEVTANAKFTLSRSESSAGLAGSASRDGKEGGRGQSR